MGRYLVAGAAGFIGSRVCARLLGDGHSVVGVDSFEGACDPVLKEWRVGRLQSPDFTLLRGDIADRAALERIFTDHGVFDGVVNLAARPGVRDSVRDPWNCFRVNLGGTLNLLDRCVKTGVEKFVLASTSSLYGDQPHRRLHEELPTDRPVSPYAASKKAAEGLCHAYHRIWGLDVSVLRYFTVYGPAGRPDMCPFRFVQWIVEERTLTVYGDGSQARDFTYVEDVARGTALALKPLGFEVVNLGNDRPVGLMDFIREIENLAGRRAKIAHAPRHPADVLTTWADISKAERTLGWRPETGLREGLARLVDWYRENRDWAGRIDTGE